MIWTQPKMQGTKGELSIIIGITIRTMVSLDFFWRFFENARGIEKFVLNATCLASQRALENPFLLLSWFPRTNEEEQIKWNHCKQTNQRHTHRERELIKFLHVNGYGKFKVFNLYTSVYIWRLCVYESAPFCVSVQRNNTQPDNRKTLYVCWSFWLRWMNLMWNDKYSSLLTHIQSVQHRNRDQNRQSAHKWANQPRRRRRQLNKS